MASVNKYKELLHLVEFTDQIKVPEIDTQAAWIRLQIRINTSAPAKTQWSSAPARWSRQFPALSRWPAAAAVVVLVLTGFFLTRHAGGKDAAIQTPAIIRIVSNEVVAPSAAALPDGSVVKLYPNSSLAYPARFPDSQRRVVLRGGASFSIAPNVLQPFVVSVKDIRITVLGTSFTVNSAPEATEIRVLSGLIRVTSPRFDLPLKAGERLMISDSFWSRSSDPVLTDDTVPPAKAALPKQAASPQKRPIAAPGPSAAAPGPSAATPRPSAAAPVPSPPVPNPPVIVPDQTIDTPKSRTPVTKFDNSAIKPKTPVVKFDNSAVNNVDHQRQLLRAILKSFVEDHLVSSQNDVTSFALTDELLTINGQRQPPSIHSKYKKSYIESPGVGFYFGPVTMTGTGIFMNKDDLFAH